MFSCVWKKNKAEEVPLNRISSFSVSGILPMLWIEHCVECAAPLCYTSCPIYKPRTDGRCLRFENGVHPILFEDGCIGGQMKFRRWAKLETGIRSEFVGIEKKKISSIVNHFNLIGTKAESLLTTLHIPWHKHRLNKMIESLCLKYLERYNSKNKMAIDGFLLNGYNHDTIPHTMLLELFENGRVIYRHSFQLNSLCWCEFFIPIEEMPINSSHKQIIRVYLEGNDIGTFTFKYLDFVSLSTKLTKNLKPAEKVKCVAWDLDNTLWDGVIGDMENCCIRVKPESLNLIKELDKRGVLQTIVSKNTYDVVWPKIQSLNLDKYFLYPAINWGRKSQNLQAIANELNINIDTFALIDDSPFERDEVSSSLPQVRVYDINEINKLLLKSEFNVDITTESSKRRESYLTEQKRKVVKESYGENYDDFLIDCQIVMNIFSPQKESDKLRCMELLQRSNQYNINKRKITQQEFDNLCNNNQYMLYAIQVSDKFGDYGIVGFASVLHEVISEYKLVDFVMSCRVAQKKVERAFFKSMVGTFNMGDVLIVDFYKTDRNIPLRKELESMPFHSHDYGAYIHFEYQKVDKYFVEDNIINVNFLTHDSIPDSFR